MLKRYAIQIALLTRIDATTFTPTTTADPQCSCGEELNTLSAQMVIFRYITSPSQVTHARNTLLSEDELTVLASVFDASLPVKTVSEVEAILGRGGHSTRPFSFPVELRTMPTGPLVRNADSTSNLLGIPEDDFIFREAIPTIRVIASELKSATEDAETLGIETLEKRMISILFGLSVAIKERSDCESLSCRVWRELTDQLLFRLSLGVVDEKWRSAGEINSELERSLRILSEVRLGEAKAMDPVIIATIVGAGVSVGCSCFNFWWNRRSTTTTPAPTPTTFDYVGAKRKTALTKAYGFLDEITQRISHSYDVVVTEATIDEIRGFILANCLKLKQTAAKLSDLGFATKVELFIKAVDDLSNHELTVVPISGWPNHRAETRGFVRSIQHQLVEITVQTQ
jgi:hypothetical protein